MEVPENGITGYVHDHTQGPACALACAPGTVFRNYLVPLPRADGSVQTGQTRDLQINNLAGVSAVLGNTANQYYTVTNGYVDGTAPGLAALNAKWASVSRDQVLGALRIGWQQDTQVVYGANRQRLVDPMRAQRVNQVYCSALSVGYAQCGDPALWANLGTAVQDALYEATLLCTILAARNDPRPGAKVALLTFIGGGVFRNPMPWICEAIGRACAVAAFHDIEVRVMGFNGVPEETQLAIRTAYNKHYKIIYNVQG
jgi:hypothetical protein